MMWRNPWDGSNVEVPANGYDYVIYTNGNNTYAKNGGTCEVDIKSDDLSEVLSEALANSSGSIKILAGKYDAYTQVELPTPDSGGYPTNFGWIIEGDSSYNSYARGTIINLHGQSKWWEFVESSNGYGYYVQTTFRNLSFIGTGAEDVITYSSPTNGGTYSNIVIEDLYFNNINRAINLISFRSILRDVLVRKISTQGIYLNTLTGGILNLDNVSVIGQTSDNYALEVHGNNIIARVIDVEDNNYGAYFAGQDIVIDGIWMERNTGMDLKVRSLGAFIAGISGAPANIQLGDSSADSASYEVYFGKTFPSNSLSLVRLYGADIYLGWYAPNWYSKITKSSTANIRFHGKGLENSGTYTVTGDGSTTSFTIAHGLVAAPSFVNITPQNGAPMPKVTADATNITLTFDTAPASGTSYTYWWEARV